MNLKWQGQRPERQWSGRWPHEKFLVDHQQMRKSHLTGLANSVQCARQRPFGCCSRSVYIVRCCELYWTLEEAFWLEMFIRIINISVDQVEPREAGPPSATATEPPVASWNNSFRPSADNKIDLTQVADSVQRPRRRSSDPAGVEICALSEVVGFNGQSLIIILTNTLCFLTHTDLEWLGTWNINEAACGHMKKSFWSSGVKKFHPTGLATSIQHPGRRPLDPAGVRLCTLSRVVGFSRHSKRFFLTKKNVFFD